MEANRKKEAIEKSDGIIPKQRFVCFFGVVIAVVVILGIGISIFISQCFGSGKINEHAVMTALGLQQNRCSDKADGCFTFFNVGNGDCSAVYNQRAFGLIDTGTASYADSLSEKLKNLQVSTIDFIVISHPHNDHAGGYEVLLRKFTVKTLYIRHYEVQNLEDYTFYQRLLSLSHEYGVTVVFPTDGMTVTVDTLQITFYVPGFLTDDENEQCLIVLAAIGEKRCLYMGDGGFLTEDVLLNRDYDVKADILKIGHHGSKTATSESFLQAVSPTYAVLCVGWNTYGHPSDLVIDLLYDYHVQVYRTDGFRQVIFTIEGSQITSTLS